MTYFAARHMLRDKREALIEWLQGEGLEARDIVDDGRFSVHNGWISGNRYIRSEDDKFIFNGRTQEVLVVPFRQRQKNPLPVELQS